MHYDDDDDMMCVSYFLTAGQLLFNVRGFVWVWVGLGQLFGGLSWAGSMKIDPQTTLNAIATCD